MVMHKPLLYFQNIILNKFRRVIIIFPHCFFIEVFCRIDYADDTTKGRMFPSKIIKSGCNSIYFLWTLFFGNPF